MPGRVFILGADGATWSVMDRLLDEGRLPHFRSVMERGVHGPLESVHNMRSASAWTSMFTGVNPGRHGIYEFYEFLPQTYSIRFIHGGHKKFPGFWTHLEAAERTAGIVNTPMTYPAETIRGGYTIAGLDGPGKESPRFCWPDDFIARLEAKMGCEYVIEPGLTGAIARGRPQEAVELLTRELESKHRALRVMLDEFPVDCLLFVFRSLDAAQHCFWKWMDPASRAVPGPGRARGRAGSLEDDFSGVIDGVYEKIDAALGEILERMGPDDHVLVISDHGFGPKCPVSSQLNRWLAAHGYLIYEDGHGRPNAVSKALRFVASRTSRRTKERLARLLPGLRDWAQSKALFSGVDWSRTRVYSDSQFPRLRLNIRGREGQGIVEQSDAPALLEELRAKLLDMRDSVTGERIVRDVFLNGEIYQGPHAAPGEDILVRWREDIPIHGVRLPDGSTADDEELSIMPGEDPKVISGDHQIHGVFLGMGPAFAGGVGGRGLGVEEGIGDMRLLDLTPTILHLCGMPIPSNLDGRVLTQAMNPDWLAANPVRFSERAVAGDGGEQEDYSEEEQKILEQRLRSLGYID